MTTPSSSTPNSSQVPPTQQQPSYPNHAYQVPAAKKRKGLRKIGRFVAFGLGSIAATSLIGGGLFYWWLKQKRVEIAAVISKLQPKQSKALPTKPFILHFDLGGKFTEAKSNSNWFMALFSDHQELNFRETIDALRYASMDPQVKGLVTRADVQHASLPQFEELKTEIKAFNKFGKPSIAYATALSNRAYYAATACKEIYLPPAGELDFVGLSSELPFLKPLLDKLEITPRFYARKEYKSFIHMFTEEHMTPASREANVSIMKSMMDHMVSGVATDRGLEKEAVRAFIDECPMNPEEAQAHKLIDGVAYFDEIAEKMKKNKTEADLPIVYMWNYARIMADQKANDPVHKALPTVAVVYAEGELMSQRDSQFNNQQVISSDVLTRKLRKIRQNDEIKAVVLRINSPGGSATASDEIWREVMRVKEAGKKIIVSMGGLAASGGYYIAAPADVIFADASTITGSIGVGGGKFAVRKMIENKLHINIDTLQDGENANYESMIEDWSPKQIAKVNKELDRFYDIFITRVADGRKMSKEDVDKVARGRVWTGAQAKEIGLVDRIGGLQDAINEACGGQPYRLREFNSCTNSGPFAGVPTFHVMSTLQFLASVHNMTQHIPFLPSIMALLNFTKKPGMDVQYRYEPPVKP